MKRKLFFICVILFFVFHKINAQTFTVIGNDSLITNINANDISTNDIFLLNQTNHDDTLAYQVTQLGVMNGWDASLCVNGNCQIGVPMSGVMMPMNANQQGLIGFNVNPFFQSGTSFLEIKIWDIQDTASKATLYFQLTLQPNNISEIKTNSVVVFPNPAMNQLRITNYELRGSSFSIKNILGEVVLENICNNGDAIDISSLRIGNYFIEIKNPNGEISRGKFCKL